MSLGIENQASVIEEIARLIAAPIYGLSMGNIYILAYIYIPEVLVVIQGASCGYSIAGSDLIYEILMRYANALEGCDPNTPVWQILEMINNAYNSTD